MAGWFLYQPRRTHRVAGCSLPAENREYGPISRHPLIYSTTKVAECTMKQELLYLQRVFVTFLLGLMNVSVYLGAI